MEDKDEKVSKGIFHEISNNPNVPEYNRFALEDFIEAFNDVIGHDNNEKSV